MVRVDMAASVSRSALWICLLATVGGFAQQKCVVCEDFAGGKTTGERPQDPGEFLSAGWKVNSERCQMKYDLGRFHTRGVVEFDVRGPLSQQPKRSLFSAWNEPARRFLPGLNGGATPFGRHAFSTTYGGVSDEAAAADGDRETQGFFQLRLMQGGMMLRLTYRRGGRSFEGKTGPLEWEDKWYHIKGAWDTEGGLCHLWRDGELLSSGRFNSSFEGFRWVFIGKDNYQKFVSIAGLVYRNLRVYAAEPELHFPPPGEGLDVPERRDSRGSRLRPHILEAYLK